MKKKKRELVSRRARRKKVILVPIDFSDSSVRALRHSVGLVRESGGTLILLYVVPADYGLLGIGREEYGGLDKSLQREGARRLSSLADTHISEGVEATLEVRIGRPAEQIVAAASESKCDLIVMSTRGHSGLDRLLIGSVADRVARLAPCPVFLMRPARTTALRERAPLSVLRYKHKRKRASVRREK